MAQPPGSLRCRPPGGAWQWTGAVRLQARSDQPRSFLQQADVVEGIGQVIESFRHGLGATAALAPAWARLFKPSEAAQCHCPADWSESATGALSGPNSASRSAAPPASKSVAGPSMPRLVYARPMTCISWHASADLWCRVVPGCVLRRGRADRGRGKIFRIGLTRMRRPGTARSETRSSRWPRAPHARLDRAHSPIDALARSYRR